MSADLDLIENKLAGLSVKELLTLQERIIAHLQVKTEPLEENVHAAQSSTPAAQQPLLRDLFPSWVDNTTDEEIDAVIASVLSLEEFEQFKNTKFDPDKLPPLPKRIVEYISEDREDRI